MTIRYVGIGGADGNSGLTWALRKATLNGAEDTPVAAGDIVYVGPGTYRELLTVDVSGGNTYAVGTVSLTAGSPTVTGLGTSFVANVAADRMFQVTVLAHGVDGVTNGTSTFTSAAGNFQAGHVGKTIRINTKAAAIIATVVGLTTITLADTAGVAITPAAGVGLTYDVGPEEPFEILSVDSDTQLTLKAPWSGPTLTGLAYLTWNPITYIGDYDGSHTDGVGGVVRITGSANDIALTRANCIAATSKNYRTFQGFLIDGASVYLVNLATLTNWIIDKCAIMSQGSHGIIMAGLTTVNNTIKNCIFQIQGGSSGILPTHAAVIDNSGHLIQNCLFYGGIIGVNIQRVGGVEIRNCTFISRLQPAVAISVALTVGQTATVNNCLYHGCLTALSATVVGEILEDYNNLIACGINRSLTTIGAHSLAYITMFDARWFFNAVLGTQPSKATTPFDFAPDAKLLNVAGFQPTLIDMRGTAVQGAQREWGALEYDSTLDVQARRGSLVGGGLVRA